MIGLLTAPIVGISIILCLALIDYPLTLLSRSAYRQYMSRYIEYPGAAKSGKAWRSLAGLIIKLVFAALLYSIWLIYRYGESEIAGVFYLWLAGFTIGSYFIIDLRHIESFLLARLYRQSEQVGGRISYHSRFSIKISAVQFFMLFMIFLLMVIISPSYFTIGLACAPLFLAVRNLLLA